MYQNYIGIDIGKDTFYVAVHGEDEVTCYSNTVEGHSEFEQCYRDKLQQGLVILETTGGYEMSLIRYLQKQSHAVHRANTRKLKHFIRSYGRLGKSDRIDALGLAHYGQERHGSLALFVERADQSLRLLVMRRQELKQMMVQEKNRLKAPEQGRLTQSFEVVLTVLKTELNRIEEEIEQIITSDKALREKRTILKTVVGIGEKVAHDLLALLPELGEVNRKQIASLGGVAPHPNESGQWVGHRFVRGGRTQVKPVLFMAAMAASRSQSELGAFYRKLLNAGKKKMVAITALMRKILVIANARIRDYYAEIRAVET